ncbi:hypothetical protein [Oceanispirochaeta sp.]|uniref:hypothetical protein n=1 Tax=Oceanispirochaeta sp. TaxID=2035350 RepID=UPI00261A93F1|nr:hypothetical protein [Oceanispirochaeta sp.]MDA3955984.1 hypothetical protein [Oceanispirochaeta sp.]
MKKKFTLAILFCGIIIPLFAETSPTVSLGFHVLAGGRYDDLRMCIASPAGVKGGPIMDIYADIRFDLDDHQAISINIPVMRPILFGAAFQMLQFEPQISYEYSFDQNNEDGGQWVVGGGMGTVFHYGPDYKSSPDDRGDSFFAMGPLFTGFTGYRLKEGPRGSWMPGVKVFYAPLFSRDYDPATMLGGGLELHYLPKN